MLGELVQNISLLDIAANTISDRSLPRALEKIAVRHIIEAIHASGDKRASLGRTLLKYSQFGVALPYILHHNKRSVIVGEVHAGPIIVDLLVDPTNKIGEGHILLEGLDSVGGVHLGDNYDGLFMNVKNEEEKQ